MWTIDKSKFRPTPFLDVFNRSAQEDPLKVFTFQIEADSFSRFGFSKMTGLKAQTADIKYREGGMNTTEQKSPGLTVFPDVTFERGQVIAPGSGSLDMVTWYQQVFDISSKNAGSSLNFRRSIDIVQFDKEGIETLRWRLIEAWIKDLDPMSDLTALTNENSIEKMVVAHEGFRLITTNVP